MPNQKIALKILMEGLLWTVCIVSIMSSLSFHLWKVLWNLTDIWCCFSFCWKASELVHFHKSESGWWIKCHHNWVLMAKSMKISFKKDYFFVNNTSDSVLLSHQCSELIKSSFFFWVKHSVIAFSIFPLIETPNCIKMKRKSKEFFYWRRYSV